MELTKHENPVWQVAAHPDATIDYICTGSADKSARIINLNGDIVKNIEGVHEKSVRTVAWHPHLPILAIGSFDSTVSLFALEDSTWAFWAQLEGPDSEVKRVAWSHDGMYLATCSRDKSVWVWFIEEDGSDFVCVAVLQEHLQDVKHVAWHPTSLLLASTSYDNSIRLWRQDDDEEWQCVSVLEGAQNGGHTSTVWGCDFDPNSMRLVSCSSDLKVKIWKLISEPAERPSSVDKEAKLPSVARWDNMSEDWELETELPAVHTDTIYSVKWSDTNKIVTGGADGRIVVYSQIHDQWQAEKVITNSHGVYEVNSVTWLKNKVLSGGDDGIAKEWDV